MHVLKVYQSYRRLIKSQWLDSLGIRELQELKLRRLIWNAYEKVSYYRSMFDRAGVKPEDINTSEDLKKIPVTRKSDLQAQGRRSITSLAFEPTELSCEHTSGSTGRPFTVLFDRDFTGVRDSLFLRALTTAGYRVGQKLLLITSDHPPKTNRRLLRWHYVPIRQSPEELLKEFNEFRPDMLYGCTTALRLLARHIKKTVSAAHRPRRVVATAEMLDSSTRGFLEEIFDAELFEFYGLTEMGIVGSECPRHEGFHLAEDTSIVEFVPIANGTGGKRMVMTNLELMSMPFIRYETNDIGLPGNGHRCSCGRGLSMLKQVEGRIVDCIKLRDGRLVSPYRITCALEKLPGVMRYQVVQDDYERFIVKVVTTPKANESLNTRIVETMQSVLGEEIQVPVARADSLEPPLGKKFRVIESRLSEV